MATWIEICPVPVLYPIGESPVRDDRVMKFESFVSCDVESLFHCITAPLVVRTVEEAPTEVRPVPPLVRGIVEEDKSHLLLKVVQSALERQPTCEPLAVRQFSVLPVNESSVPSVTDCKFLDASDITSELTESPVMFIAFAVKPLVIATGPAKAELPVPMEMDCHLLTEVPRVNWLSKLFEPSCTGFILAYQPRVLSPFSAT